MPVPIVPGAPGSPVASGTPGARGSRRIWLVVAGLVAVVGLVAVAIVTVFGGDDDAVDTSEALAAIDDFDEALVGDVDEAVGNDEEIAFIDLDDCVLGDLDDLIDFVPDDLRLPDVDADIFDAYALGLVDVDEGTAELTYQCYANDQDDRSQYVGMSIGKASEGEHRRFVRRVFDGFDLEFFDDLDHRGGVIVTFCGEASDSDDESLAPFCEADWIGGGVQVGVFATVDADAVEPMQEFAIAALDHLLAEVSAQGDLDLPDES